MRVNAKDSKGAIISRIYGKKWGINLKRGSAIWEWRRGERKIWRKLRSDREGTAITNVRVYHTISLCKPCPYGLLWASTGFTRCTGYIRMALSLDIACTLPFSGIYGIHFLSILYLSIYCISKLKKWMQKQKLLLIIILNKK